MKLEFVLFTAAALLVGSAGAKVFTPARGRVPSATAGVATQKKPAVKKTVAKTVVAPAPAQTAFRKNPFVGAMAVDAASGAMLFQQNADAKARPASVTKLMTLLLVLEDVQAGKYTFADNVAATPEVNRCQASWVGLKAGETMTVRDLCLALMVESANDAAIVLGVKSAGSTAGFVARMNARAQELGMADTKYYNPNGLPAPRYGVAFNESTAADQVKLALEILKHPETVKFTSVKTCDLVRCPGGHYRVSVTRQVNKPQAATQLKEGEALVKQFCNHNNVMVKDKLKIFNPDGSEAVDGLKTGYIDAGGSSVVVTAVRNGRRIVAVVLGSASAKMRDAAVRAIVEKSLGK